MLGRHRHAIALGCAALMFGCSDTPSHRDTSDTNIGVVVGALTFPGVVDVCFSVAVTNGGGELVVGRGPSHIDPTRHAGGTLPYALPVGYADPSPAGLCASRFGNAGGGDLSYVAPCDGSDGNAPHRVTLWLDTLTLDGPVVAATGVDYQDPCPVGCSLPVTCRENADTPVRFDLTIVRPANQGFFDIGVSFEPIFCSAKVDCEGPDGGDLLLLHDPATGERGSTAVFAVACTSGAGDTATVLVMDDLVVRCDDSATTLDPSLGEGNIYGPVIADPDPDDAVWQYAIYSGYESLSCGAASCGKAYWNIALGFDTTSDNCHLETSASAGGTTTFVGTTTPANSNWPRIVVHVPLTADGGGRVCGQHPLEGGPDRCHSGGRLDRVLLY